MKKLITISILLAFGFMSQAQIFSFGVKGGINSSKINFDDFGIDASQSVTIDPDYFSQNADGSITIDPNVITIDPTTGQVTDFNPDIIDLSSPKVTFEPSSYDVGFHFGAFARIKIAMLFLQPELIFTQTNSNINISPEGFDPEQAANEVINSEIKYNNFDIPILLGIKMGPAHLCVGPVATFKLSSSIDDATKELLEEIETEEGINIFTATKNATFGAQVGAGLTIAKKVTIDLRYEFGLSKLGESVTIGDTEFKTDTRVNQFIGSIGYIF